MITTDTQPTPSPRGPTGSRRWCSPAPARRPTAAQPRRVTKPYARGHVVAVSAGPEAGEQIHAEVAEVLHQLGLDTTKERPQESSPTTRSPPATSSSPSAAVRSAQGTAGRLGRRGARRRPVPGELRERRKRDGERVADVLYNPRAQNELRCHHALRPAAYAARG